MNLKGLLHGIMYKDTATVIRLVSVTAEDGSDDWRESEEPVYTDIPCKLSQYNHDLTASKTARSMSIGLDLRLCCDPEYDIRENDRIEVLHQGKLFKLYAGTRFPYSTHQEISMRRRMEAGNDEPSD